MGMERSGVVREAFRASGHDAYSCDLEPADDGSPYHLQMDALEAVRLVDPDLAIFHPMCTYLTCSGINLCTQPQERYPNSLVGEARVEAMHDAAATFMDCYDCGVRYVAVENPQGRMSTIFRQPDQYIHPWMFGHGETKMTGLWLKGLPKLVATDVVEGRADRIHKESPGIVDGMTRAQRRSKTYRGIAEAMADQWGRFVMEALATES